MSAKDLLLPRNVFLAIVLMMGCQSGPNETRAAPPMWASGETTVGELKIGYIDLPSFYGGKDAQSTTADVRKILAGFQSDGVDAVIVDLRRNGGGLLPEAVSLPDLFLDEGPIVQVKGRGGKVQTYSTEQAGAVWSGPLVLLTSRMTASGAEIFAGAIQDHGRGTIIGSRSYGKGSVQGIFPLNLNGAGVRLTTAKFYSPNGHPYSRVGVQPDLVVQHRAKPITGTIAETVSLVDHDPMLSAALSAARNLTTQR